MVIKGLSGNGQSFFLKKFEQSIIYATTKELWKFPFYLLMYRVYFWIKIK